MAFHWCHTSSAVIMLFKHTAYYFLARGLPGIINFLALSVYTRLLMPEEYGRYALVIATVSLVGSVLFQWIVMGLLRFFPHDAGHEERLLSTILAAYLVMVAGSGGIGTVVYGLLEPGPWRAIMPVALLLLWVQAWFEINLQLLASRSEPIRYGALAGTRAILALAVGGCLAWVGFGSAGAVMGACLWRRCRCDLADAGALEEHLL